MTKMLSVATAAVFEEQPRDKDHKRFPRVDYIELQDLLNADTIDYSAYNENYAGKLFRHLETQLRSDIYLTTISWLKSCWYPLVFAWSERVGIPFAGYRRIARSNGRFVTMFQCWSDRQAKFITSLNLFPAMDRIIVHCASMKDNLIQLGAPAERVKVIHYSIDQSFYSPLANVKQRQDMIMSVGEPRSRDYPSLFRAVDELPVTLVVAGYGHWYAREKSQPLGVSVPRNVSMTKHLSYFELRQQYASSQFVVLPIRNLVYSAGATAALESASMARAVIAFRSQGITDYIIDGETGILVEPGDVGALKSAIQFLLANPGEAKRLGQNARQRIIEELNLETYVNNIANLLMQQ